MMLLHGASLRADEVESPGAVAVEESITLLELRLGGKGGLSVSSLVITASPKSVGSMSFWGSDWVSGGLPLSFESLLAPMAGKKIDDMRRAS